MISTAAYFVERLPIQFHNIPAISCSGQKIIAEKFCQEKNNS
jgi:hypothetical protein